jgi:phage shock protein E
MPRNSSLVGDTAPNGGVCGTRSLDLVLQIKVYGYRMPTDIDLSTLDRLLVDGALLIEVLPEGEYEEEHLPGAVNMALKTLTAERVAELDPGRPVVVYCWDAL